MHASPDAGPTSHILMSQRLRLHYLDWGNVGAPPLILVHGGRDHARSWDWVALRLRADWHVIVPDLRGHGDSAWSSDGSYILASFVYDLAQLIHQLGHDRVTIVAHSLGAAISLRYAGNYPERVAKLCAIEGVGLPSLTGREPGRPIAVRMREWIEERRALAARLPRRYPTIDAAQARMIEENPFLSVEQARHLTVHGVTRNEDGSYSWKFDNYLRSVPPLEISDANLIAIWQRIECPVMLAWGENSFASDPGADGRAAHFQNAHVARFADAGHWLHHDQFERFMARLTAFLGQSER